VADPEGKGNQSCTCFTTARLYGTADAVIPGMVETTEGGTMAIPLTSTPMFEILSEYAIPPHAGEVYTKLLTHHGDRFGKCTITTAGAKFKIAQIRIITFHEQQELNGKTLSAIWGELGPLKIRNAHQGKDTLHGITMLLVEAEALPVYLQRQMKET
jgi:hypothetical protein